MHGGAYILNQRNPLNDNVKLLVIKAPQGRNYILIKMKLLDCNVKLLVFKECIVEPTF